jgi:hypothetical protein
MQTKALVLLLTTASLGGCASSGIHSSQPITEERSVSAFRSIALNGIGTVRVHRGPQSVRVTIDSELADRFETVVRDDTLYIGFKCSLKPSVLRAVKNLRRCEVDVTVPEILSIEVNGSGRITSDSFDYGSLRVALTGAALVELKGTAETLEIRSTGDTEISAAHLDAGAASVGITGSGKAELRVRERLDASITGAGILSYWGTPAVTRRISGAGTIKRLGE